jgi:hypothetical protein
MGVSHDSCARSQTISYRRIMAGQAAKTLSEFAQEILDRFQEAHPSAPAMTLDEVEDHIRVRPGTVITN